MMIMGFFCFCSAPPKQTLHNPPQKQDEALVFKYQGSAFAHIRLTLASMHGLTVFQKNAGICILVRFEAYPGKYIKNAIEMLTDVHNIVLIMKKIVNSYV
jgi:hypothetical protein